MIRKIKSTDKIGDSRKLINANFKELDERLKRIERKSNSKPTSK